MERYLVFDAGCITCQVIAHSIDEAAAGKLHTLSMQSQQAIQLLRQAFPQGWEHQPYLITIKGRTVTAVAGTKMAFKLGTLLGLRKGWHVYNLAQRYGVKLLPTSRDIFHERRHFLKKGTALVSGIFLARVGALNPIEFTTDGGKTKIKVKELKEPKLVEFINQAKDNPNAKMLWDYLETNGFTTRINEARGSSITATNETERRDGFVTEVPFGAADSRVARHFFATDGSKTTTGAGVFYLNGEKVTKIEVFEVVDGHVVLTQTILPNDDGSFGSTQPHIASSVFLHSAISTSITPLATSNCDICKSVYNYIYNAGCGLSGYFICLAACAAFTGPAAIACGAICAVVYAVICVYSQGNLPPEEACRGFGYC